MVRTNLTPCCRVTWPSLSSCTPRNEVIAPAVRLARKIRLIHKLAGELKVLVEPVLSYVSALEYDPVHLGCISDAGAHTHRSGVEFGRRRMRYSVVPEKQVIDVAGSPTL